MTTPEPGGTSDIVGLFSAKFQIYERKPNNQLEWVCQTDDRSTADQYLRGLAGDDRKFAVVTRDYYIKNGLDGVKGL